MNKKLLDILNIVLENNDLKTLDGYRSTMVLQDELGLDSIMLAELTVRLEDEFEIDVFEEGMVHSIGDIEKRLGIN